MPRGARFLGEMRIERLRGRLADAARAGARSSERTSSSQATALLALAADQRMLEQRQQRRPAPNPPPPPAAIASSKVPGGSLRQRPPGAVVGLDPPPREQRRHALRQHPVGRDQRGRPPRRLERLAQRQRDRLRFRGGVGQLGGANAGQPALGAA